MTAAPAGGGLAEVGVLVAIDDALHRLHATHNAAAGKQREVVAEEHGNLTEARAAIAELIEADKEYDAALGLVRQTEATYGKRSAAAGRARAALDLANERRAAALSNIEGGQQS